MVNFGIIQEDKILPAERRLAIIKYLKEHNTSSITSLSEVFLSSPNTIRKDLKILEREGLVKCVYGGVMISDNSSLDRPLLSRRIEAHEEKVKIAQKAVGLIREGDTIILDAGTTTEEIAKALRGKKDITVITNAINIAQILVEESDITVTLSGGILMEKTHSLIGFTAEQFFQDIHADKLFLSAGGVSFEYGLTNPNVFEIPVKKAMMKSAKEIILVVHSEKLGRNTLVSFASLDSINKVIVDAKISPQFKEELEARGLEVIMG